MRRLMLSNVALPRSTPFAITALSTLNFVYQINSVFSLIIRVFSVMMIVEQGRVVSNKAFWGFNLVLLASSPQVTKLV